MPVATANGLPSSFTQGDTVSFGIADTRYPSGTWELGLALALSGKPAAPVAGAAQGDGSFLFTLTPVASAALAPGLYLASLIATETGSGQRISLGTRSLFVRPDLSVPLAQTPNMLALAAMKKGLATLSAGTVQTFSGGGQSWTKRTLGELRREIDRLQVDVNNELRALGLSTKGGAVNIVTRFGS